MGAAPGGCSPCSGRRCSASRPSESTPWRDVPERLACGWAFGATSGRVVVQIIPENLRSGTSGRGGTKKRGARQPHKRLQYCVNVNRTSPDHLLLGRNADIDKSVECSEYSAGLGKSQNKCSLTWCLTRGVCL